MASRQYLASIDRTNNKSAPPDVLDDDDVMEIANKINEASDLVRWLNEAIDEINSRLMFVANEQLEELRLDLDLELDALRSKITDNITELY